MEKKTLEMGSMIGVRQLAYSYYGNEVISIAVVKVVKR